MPQPDPIIDLRDRVMALANVYVESEEFPEDGISNATSVLRFVIRKLEERLPIEDPFAGEDEPAPPARDYGATDDELLETWEMRRTE